MTNAQLLARLDAALAKLSPSIRDAFLDAMARAATAVDLAALIDALERRDVFAAQRILSMGDAVLYPAAEAIRSGFIAAGSAVANDLPMYIRATFGFGGNPAAVAKVQEITGEFITNIVAAQRQTVQLVVSELVNEGIPARTAALQIVGKINKATGLREGGFIELDAPRAAQAKRVAAMLRDPDAIRDYFIQDRETGQWKPRYKTTDRRYDRTVLKAISDGRALTKAEADKITRAHSARLLKNRADTIARNEGINAMRAAEHAGWVQMVESGAIENGRIERTWLAARDSHVRDHHVMMNGTKVRGVYTPWAFPAGGQALFPGDASLGASPDDLINCRCVEVIRLVRANG